PASLDHDLDGSHREPGLHGPHQSAVHVALPQPGKVEKVQDGVPVSFLHGRLLETEMLPGFQVHPRNFSDPREAIDRHVDLAIFLAAGGLEGFIGDLNVQICGLTLVWDRKTATSYPVVGAAQRFTRLKLDPITKVTNHTAPEFGGF